MTRVLFFLNFFRRVFNLDTVKWAKRLKLCQLIDNGMCQIDQLSIIDIRNNIKIVARALSKGRIFNNSSNGFLKKMKENIGKMKEKSEKSDNSEGASIFGGKDDIW